eukprot:NODE_125_length_17255_cov_0.877827.p1 type:complete len:1682 gc:universal NODE_125_length_17255_cov_0.877827:3028-8073(+)
MQHPQTIQLQESPLVVIDSINSGKKDFDLKRYIEMVRIIISQSPQFFPQFAAAIQNHPNYELYSFVLSVPDEKKAIFKETMVKWTESSDVLFCIKAIQFLASLSKNEDIPDLFPLYKRLLPKYTYLLISTIRTTITNGKICNHYLDVVTHIDPDYIYMLVEPIKERRPEINNEEFYAMFKYMIKKIAQYKGPLNFLYPNLKQFLVLFERVTDQKIAQQVMIFLTTKLHAFLSTFLKYEFVLTLDQLKELEKKKIDLGCIKDPLLGTNLYVWDEKQDFKDTLVLFKLVIYGIRMAIVKLLPLLNRPSDIPVETYEWITTAVELIFKLSSGISFDSRFGVDLDRPEKWFEQIQETFLDRSPHILPECLTQDYKTYSTSFEIEIVESITRCLEGIPVGMLSTILPQPELMIQSCKFHCLRLGLIQSMFNSQILSPAVSTHYFKYFQKCLNYLHKLDDLDMKIHIRVAKLTFINVTLYPEGLNSVIPEIPNFIMNSLDYYVKTGSYVYLMIFKHVFRSIGNQPKESIYQLLEPCVPDLLEVLMNSLHIPRYSFLCTEILLTLPAKLTLMSEYLSSLVAAISVGLDAPFLKIQSFYDEKVCNLALQSVKSLNTCVENLSEDSLRSMIEPYLERLVIQLNRIVNCRFTEIVGDELPIFATKVLCKLKSRCESFYNCQFGSCVLLPSNSKLLELRTENYRVHVDYVPCFEAAITMCKDFLISHDYAMIEKASPDINLAIDVAFEFLKAPLNDNSVLLCSVWKLVFYSIHFGSTRALPEYSMTDFANNFAETLHICTDNTVEYLQKSNGLIPLSLVLAENLGNYDFTTTYNALHLLRHAITFKEFMDAVDKCHFSKQIIFSFEKFGISNQINKEYEFLLNFLNVKTKEFINFAVKRAFCRRYIYIDSYINFLGAVQIDPKDCDFLPKLLEIPINALESSFQVAFIKNVSWYLTQSYHISVERLEKILADAIPNLKQERNNRATPLKLAFLHLLLPLSRIESLKALLVTKNMLNVIFSMIFSPDKRASNLCFKILQGLRTYIMSNELLKNDISEHLNLYLKSNKNMAGAAISPAPGQLSGLARLGELFPVSPNVSNAIDSYFEAHFASTAMESEGLKALIQSSIRQKNELTNPSATIEKLFEFYCIISSRTQKKYLDAIESICMLFGEFKEIVADKIINYMDVSHEKLDLMLFIVKTGKLKAIMEVACSKISQIGAMVSGGSVDFISLKMYSCTKFIACLAQLGPIENTQVIMFHLKCMGAQLTALKGTLQSATTNFLVFYSQVYHLYFSFQEGVIKKIFPRFSEHTSTFFLDPAADYTYYVDQVQRMCRKMYYQEKEINQMASTFLKALATVKETFRLEVYFDLILEPILRDKNLLSEAILECCAAIIWKIDPNKAADELLECAIKFTKLIVQNQDIKNIEPRYLDPLIAFVSKSVAASGLKPLVLKSEILHVGSICTNLFDIPVDFFDTIFKELLQSLYSFKNIDLSIVTFGHLVEYISKRLKEETPKYVTYLVDALNDQCQHETIVSIMKLCVTFPDLFLPHLKILEPAFRNHIGKISQMSNMEIKTIMSEFLVFMLDRINEKESMEEFANAALRFVFMVMLQPSPIRFQWSELIKNSIIKNLKRVGSPVIKYESYILFIKSDFVNSQTTATRSGGIISLKNYLEVIMVDVQLRSKSWTQQTYFSLI